MRIADERWAVSPIIATILMVAVTIVLAGVLYVMIIGMGGGSNDDLAPLGSWHDVDAVNQTTAKLVFGPFTADVNPIDIKLFLYEDGVDETTTIVIQVPLTATNGNPCSVSGYNDSVITATYSDNSYTTNLINGGDFLEISGLAPGKYYRAEVYHVPSQSILSMTGDNPAFQMP